MSHRSRWEYLRAIHARYRQADRRAKQVILNEFCANTRYHRKYAIRLLNGPPPGRAQPQVHRARSPRYGSTVASVLAAVWEAAGYPWAVDWDYKGDMFHNQQQAYRTRKNLKIPLDIR